MSPDLRLMGRGGAEHATSTIAGQVAQVVRPLGEVVVALTGFGPKEHCGYPGSG